MADADAEEVRVQQARQLPYPQRLSDRNWKIRRDAFEDIRAGCSRGPPADSTFGQLLAKGVGDANAAAQDAALEALLAYLNASTEEQAAKISEQACTGIASKVLKQRVHTVSKATDVCMAFVELEQGEVMLDAIVVAFSDKVPKAVQAAATLVEKAVSSFGLKVIPPKPLIAALPKLYDSKAAPVRELAKSLTVLVSRWLGASTAEATLLSKMSEMMRKDVDKALAEASSGKPQPSRFTRKEMLAREAAQMEQMGIAEGVPGASPMLAAAAAVGAAAPADDDEDVDAYDISDPVNILPELRGWDEEVASTVKWALRRDLLTKLKTLAGAPHLAPGDFGDVLRRLRIVIGKDSNVVCVAEAIACLQALAKGLRKDFKMDAKSFVALLLDKFKDKNSAVCRNTAAALLAMHRYCFSLGEVADEYAAAMAGKLPKPKVEVMKVLAAAVAVAGAKDAVKVQVQLVPLLAKAAMEPAPEVREAALQALVAFATVGGEVAKMSKMTDRTLDDKRRKALSDMIASAGGSGIAAPLTAASLPKTASLPRSTTGPPSQAASVAGSSRGPSEVGGPSAQPAARPRPRVGSATGGSAASGPADDDDSALSIGTLDRAAAEEKLDALFGVTTCTALAAPAWKERVETITQVADQVEQNEQLQDPTLIQCMAYLPGWGEKNFQVFAKMLQLIITIAQRSPQVGKRDAFVAISGFTDRIADGKLKVLTCEALTALSEAVGPQFVATQLHNKAAAQKSPKVLTEALGWLAVAVEEFGLAVFDMRRMMDWCVGDLGSRDATVRTAATSVLAAAHRQTGPALAAMLRPEVKPALMTTLEDAFAANPLAQVVPVRFCRGAAPAASSGRPRSRKGLPDAATEPAASEPQPDPSDFLPRIDISSQVTEDLMKKLGSANWKERSAALDAVAAAVQGAGGRITPSLGDLMGGLKPRLADANKNLTQRTLHLLGELGAAMGPPIERAARPCFVPALQCLADKKKPIRDAVIGMLSEWVGASGRVPVEKLAPAIVDTLTAPKMSPEGRVAAIDWLADACAAAGPGCKCLDSGLRTAVFCAADKSNEVRKAGDALMAQLLQSCGNGPLSKAAMGMTGREKAPAVQLLQKHGVQPNAAVSAAPAAVAAPAVAVQAAAGPSAAPVALNQRKPHSAFPGLRQPSGPIAAAAAPVEERAAPLLQISTRKESRLRQMHFKGGKFDGPRPDEEDNLKAELLPLVSPAFGAALFGKDFTRHMAAAEMLTADLPASMDAVVASLDLLFRWLILRICEANPQCLLKVCDLAKALLDALYEQGYKLAEAEAQILMPCLVEKAGHGQERIRAMHRELLLQSCGVFESQRVCEFLVLGLASKNNRTRIEVIEVLGELIGQEGIIVYQGARYKPLPAVAQLVTDRDRGVRAAALGLMAVVYQQEGVALWKLVGRLGDQQRSLIEERLKSTDKQAAQQGLEIGYRRAERQGRAYSEYGDDAAEPDHGQAAGYGQDYSNGDGYAHSQHGGPSPEGSQYGDGRSAAAYEQQQPQYAPYGQQPPQYAEPPPQVEPFYQHQPFAVSAPAARGFRGAPGDASAAASRFAPGGYLANGSTPVRAAPSQAPPYSYAPTPGTYQQGAAFATPVPAATPAAYVEEAYDTEPLRSDEAVEAAWEEGLALLNDRHPEKQVEGIKALGAELSEMMEGRASAVSEARFARDANAMVAMLSKRLRTMFMEAFSIWERTRRPAPHRRCKYTVSLLMRVWSLPLLARSVAADTLREFVAAMLLTLIDSRVLEIQEGGNLMKALNVLMLKTLENCERTAAFTALLLLTRDAPVEVRHRPDASGRFFDLAVKCLIKISKALSDDLQEIECATVLLAVDDFFRQLGLAEIRLRSSRDDKPLRMVKTLLHELCKKKGMRILDDMHAISESEPLPIIRAYIDLNLLTLHQAGLITGPLPARIAARVQSLTSDASARAPPQPPAPRYSISGSLDGSSAAPAAGPQTPQQLQSQQPVPLQPRTAPQRTDSPARRQSSAPRPAWQPGGEDIAADTPHPAESPAQPSTPGSVLSPAEQELKQRLVAALDQLGERGAAGDGMEALHDWLHRHPQLNLDAFLAGANERLRTYFYQELRQVAARRQGGRYDETSHEMGQDEVADYEAPSTPPTRQTAAPIIKVNSVDVLKERLNRLPPMQGGEPQPARIVKPYDLSPAL